MAKKKRSWFAKLIWPQPAQRARPRVPGFRNLAIERLETRALLSGAPTVSLTQLLAQLTPDPHPSGDMPTNTSQLVSLANYTQGLVPPDTPTDPALHAFTLGIEQVYSDIQNNPDARPAYWGENVAGGANQYRIHLDDNGMLVNSWTINWGDGSDPQTIQPQPWLVHQYPAAGDYTIAITATSRDGTYAANSTSGIELTDAVGIGGSGNGLQVTMTSVPPTLHVAATQTVALGATFALDNLVSVSSPDAAVNISGNVTTDYSYSVDWGDGSAAFSGSNIDIIAAGGNGTPFMGALRSDTADGPLTHVYTDPGTYDLNVTVTNGSGLSDTQTIPITVDVLAPTITAAGLLSGNTCPEGTQVNLSASTTADPSLSDPVAYNWQITDSEGNTVVQSTDPNLNYTFTYADTYTVSLVASVDNVQSAPATTTITVSNVAPSFVGSIATGNVSAGQAFNLSAAFTDPNPIDTHTVTVDWGDGSPLDTGATVTEESSDGSTPGSITDSYTYTLPTGVSSQTYTGTIYLTDSEGLATPATFTVNVVSATVQLNSFTASSDGSQLQVSYTIANANAAPFNIGIYTSPDGSTPDQLLMSVHVDGTTFPLTEGTNTASFTPQFDDIQSNYHLIAVTDANSDATQNTVEFAGGIFVAQSVTASPPQNILYVFGSNTGDVPSTGDTVYIHGNADSPTNTVVFNSGTWFSIGSTITDIHVRGEAGNDIFQADADVSLPLWLFGGSGNSTLVGGAGTNFIVGGSGQNIIHSSNGLNSPQTVDDSDTATAGLANYFQDTGSAGSWSPQDVAGAFNGGELSHAASTGTDAADWTFANLDPTAYYDVYVTWTPIAGASTAAQYGVYDNTTAILPIGQTSIATVNQNLAPAEYQAAGTYWRDLGVFQVTSGTLVVQLGTDGSGSVLADAAMILPHATRPLTNLTMDSFGVDSDGNLAVTYTISGEDSPPFSIGIYQSVDGVRLTALAGTIDVSDPGDLAGDMMHTLVYDGDLNGLAGGQYYVAQLDCYGQVQESTKADNISLPLTGVFQTGDGSLYGLIGNDGSSHTLAFSEDLSTGNVTATLDGSATTFPGVSVIYAVAYHGACTIDASGASVATTLYCGDGPDTIIGGQGNNEVYGGAGVDTLNGVLGQNNWMQAGSGNATLLGGSGHDWLVGGSGIDFIYGGPGTEKLFGGSGVSYLYGGKGLDDITGGSGTNFIYGNGINDRLVGGSGKNFIQPNTAYPPNAMASVEIENSSGAPTSGGNIDASGNPDAGDYRAIPDPGYGGPITEVDWNFQDFASGVRLGEGCTTTPLAVYVTWRNDADPGSGNHWSNSSAYVVYDNGAPLNVSSYSYMTTVNQGTSPGGASPEGADRLWTLLGVWNVGASDTITVSLFNYDQTAGSVLCVGDVMIHAIWPTVSIRPTNVTVNPNVPSARTGDYVDWVDACLPVQVPVEGQGDRVQLQLNASIETLYYRILGSTSSDWQATLPNVAGLEFWNAATDGTQLAPDVNGNVLDGSLALSGEYSQAVWTSVDPNSMLATGSASGSSALVPIVADVDGTDGALIPCQAQVTPSLGITGAVVTSGSVTGHDSNVTNPFGKQDVGPFGMGALYDQAANLQQITELAKTAPGLTVDKLIQYNTKPTDPNHTFPSSKSDNLEDYQAYYFTYENGSLKDFWALAPYAITFTLPNKDPTQYSFSVSETRTLSVGEPDRYDPKKIDWTSSAPKKTDFLTNKSPVDPTTANIDTQDSNISWGLVTPAGGGAQVAQVVITDTPSMIGKFDESYKQENVLAITIKGQAGATETWEYSFTLERDANMPPVFTGGKLKKL